MNKPFFFRILLISALFGCKKEKEIVTFTDNTIPLYNEVSTLLVENYVNRLYIDLIGREPTDVEMSADVTALEAADLSASARTAVVNNLMNSTAPLAGDVSLNHAFHRKMYEDHKARFLAGASESDMYESYNLYYYLSVQDSMIGNTFGFEILRAEANKMLAAIESNENLRTGAITIGQMCYSMCYNVVYDDINMGTFNFTNATFNDLYFRYPTEAELLQANDPIEFNGPGLLFGQLINSKVDYLELLTSHNEFAEGMIRWAYSNLLSREPETIEVFNQLDVFNDGQNIKAVQLAIAITDEYAGFE